MSTGYVCRICRGDILSPNWKYHADCAEKELASLRADLTAALAHIAEKEGQVCRMQEVGNAYVKFIESYAMYYVSVHSPEAKIITEFKHALSSSSPCRHQSALAELREFIEERLMRCVSDQRGAYQDVRDHLLGGGKG